MKQNKPNQEGEAEVSLKALMETAEITEPELSRRIDVGVRIINDWKKRRKMPRLDNAVAMARELNVPLKTICKALGLDVDRIPPD